MTANFWSGTLTMIRVSAIDGKGAVGGATGVEAAVGGVEVAAGEEAGV